MSLNKVVQHLSEVPDKLLEGGEEALVETAHLMVGYIQVTARVDTGSYRDSARMERVPARAAQRVIRVRVGGYVVNPKTRRLVDYATFLERRYRTVENAWEQVRGQVEAIIRRKCMAQLKQIEVAGVLRFPE